VLVVFAVATATLNLFLMSFAFGALVGPCSRVIPWEGTAMRLLKYVPFTLDVVQFAMMFSPLITTVGAFNQLPLVHF
jgi:hypothetical protein